MNELVQMKINGRWVLVEEAPPDCRDLLPRPEDPESWWPWEEPEEEQGPRHRPVYKTFVIRRPGPPDPRAVEAVLEWLNSGCSSG